MRVVRFMTRAEKDKYLAGRKMMNKTRHRDLGLRSTSIGFCFAELTAERDADKWLHKLTGIRPCEYCIEFETDDFKIPLYEGKATYADDDDFEWSKTMQVREWSTTIYNLRTHPYRRIGICPSFIQMCMGQKIEWL